MRVQKNNKGFTLVEVLIAVSILAVLVVPLVANFVTSSKVNQKTKRVMNSTSIAQNIMEGISSYGVEDTIIQLEDSGAEDVELKFIPENMQPKNWGKAKIKYTTSTDPTTGEAVYRPDYDIDRYQDDDNRELIRADAYLEGIFNDGSDVVNSAFTSKYLKLDAAGKIIRDANKKPTFLPDNDLHAYMFWMKDIEYAGQKYDVLLSIDANKYRGSEGDTLDTAAQDLSSYTSRDALQNAINNSGHELHKDRNYNTLKLADVTNGIGTDAAENDSIRDRYYMEDGAAFDNALNFLLLSCVHGTTREELQKNIKREMYIDIRREANVIDGSKPYTVIGVTFKYTIADASMIDTASGISEYVEAEKVIFRSCEIKPRNVYFFYTPNYYPTDYTGSGKDEIYVTNTAGDTVSGVTYGEELNLYIVRQCATEMTTGSLRTDLINSEGRYKVKLTLNENIKDDVVENIKTHLFSNIDYCLARDEHLGNGSMGTYILNSRAASADDIDLSGLIGSGATDDEDYIYDITIEVFRAGFGYSQEERLARFRGSSN
ncbi:MAG: prepilin-type N-terminal cleavage/methylation domain-containing protein [Lachnospiraceae bacterium]|nr:prepilin-type N-terminal cleavage/methylation domain-containing protein [Lachnospiraceae bacterium]